jgi:hypothetical protein
MPWFTIRMEGRFTPATTIGDQVLGGFFVTRFCGGSDVEEATNTIVSRLRHDLHAKGLPHADGQVSFRRASMREHSLWRPSWGRQSGFAFYLADDSAHDDPEDEARKKTVH